MPKPAKIVSFSEIRTHGECQRKWYLTYRRRLMLKREAPSTPAHAGTLIHEWLRSFYFPGEHQDPFPAAWEVCESEEWAEERDSIAKTIKLCEAVTKNYLAWRHETKADENFVPQQSELRFKIDDPRPLFGESLAAGLGYPRIHRYDRIQ